MPLCDYGCGNKGKYQFKNGNWCCNYSTSKCPFMRKRNSEKNKGRELSDENKQTISKSRKGKKFSKEHRKKLSDSHKGKKLSISHKLKISISNKGRVFSEDHKRKLSEKRTGVSGFFKGKRLSIEHREKISFANKGKIVSEETKEKLRELNRFSIEDYQIKYPFFSQIEEMRYNPDKPGEKEIQVHCKNHLCKNSKEKNGWFTPTDTQIYERKRALETNDGSDGCYFYCSKNCKEVCPLYNLRTDSSKKLHTEEEYQQFKEFVLERDNYECQYCGEKAEHVHHERPQKLEPFFVLDPDFAWSVCKKCHYKYGHKTETECSTGNLANKVCI